MNFVRDDFINIGVDEWNTRIDKYFENHGVELGVMEHLPNGGVMARWAELQIEEHITYTQMCLREGTHVYRYRCHYDGETHNESRYSSHIARAYYKTLPGIKDQYAWPENKSSVIKTRLFHTYKKEYCGRYIPGCIGYDFNSHFASVMIKGIPDYRVEPKKNCEVGDGEVGFKYVLDDADGKYFLDIVLQNEGIADIVYPVMEPPKELKELIKKWYRIKSTTKDKEEKAKAKAYLVQGYTLLGKKFPPIRAYVAGMAGRHISSLMDENTIRCNVDCIVSTVRRPDLEAIIGSGLGQLKIEGRGTFCMTSVNTYDWIEQGVHKANGVNLSLRKEGYDCLHPERKYKSFPYRFDRTTGKVVKNEIRE